MLLNSFHDPSEMSSPSICMVMVKCSLLLDAAVSFAVHAHTVAQWLVCVLQIAPAIPSCISALAGEQGILMRVIKNPTQPGFNHYLFESVAALVKQGCAKDAGMVDKLEEMLVPPFNHVLSQDVQVNTAL